MARLFIDGFEHGDLNLWEDPTGHVDNSSKVTGAYSFWGDGSYCAIYKSITPSTIVYVAVRLISTYLEGESWQVTFLNASDLGACWVNAQAYVAGNWVITLARNGDSSIATYDLIGASECHLQVKMENISTSSKRVIVKVNNVERIDETFSVDALYQGATTPKIKIGNANGHDSYADDIVIDDSDWPGAPFIYGLTPTGDGATTEWTPSSGETHYPLVDEIPASSTDYVSSTTSGEVELYTFSNLPDTDVWSVNSVQVSAYAKTPGPPEDEYLQLGVRHAGANYFGAPVQLSTDFTQKSTIFENNPLTGSAWTQDDVHSGEFGFKEVS